MAVRSIRHGTAFYHKTTTGADASPQLASFHEGDTEGHQMFVQLESLSRNHVKVHRSYGSYPDAETFVFNLISCQASQAHFYELIREGRPCKLYLDIEWEVPQQLSGTVDRDERLAALKRVLTATLTAVTGMMHISADLRYASGSRVVPSKVDPTAFNWRFSFHITVRNVVCDNNHATMNQLMTMVFAHYAEQEPHMWWQKPVKATGGTYNLARTCIADLAIYTKNRAWRTPFSSKAADRTATLLRPVGHHGLIHPMRASALALDMLVTNVPNTADGTTILVTWTRLVEVALQLGLRPPTAPQQQQQTAPQQPQEHRTALAYVPGEDGDRVRARLQQMLREHGDETSVVLGRAEGREDVYICSNFGHLRTCAVLQPGATASFAVHKSNNFFFYLAQNSVYYRCHAYGCKQLLQERNQRMGVFYGYLDLGEPALVQEEPAVPSSTSTTTAQDEQSLRQAVEAAMRRGEQVTLDVYCNDRVRPYCSYSPPGAHSAKVQLVRSDMKTYKTQSLKELIGRTTDLTLPIGYGFPACYVHTDSIETFPRVLIITSRISLSHSLFGEFKKLGFAHYQDPGVQQQAAPQQPAGQPRNQRLVWEYESLHRLPGLSEAAGFDLVICDEITTQQQSMTSQVLSSDEMEENMAVFSALVRGAKHTVAMCADMTAGALHLFRAIVGDKETIAVQINEHNAWPGRKVVELPTLDDAIGRIAQDLDAGLNVLICVGVKKRMGDRIEREVLKPNPKCNYRYYHRDGDDAELRNDMLNIDQVWSRQRAVMYTSKVMVGGSFNVPDHFHKVYVLGSYRTALARELVQMACRVRNPVDMNVYAYIEDRDRKKDPFAKPGCIGAIRRDLQVRLAQLQASERRLLGARLDGASLQWTTLGDSALGTLYTFNLLERNIAFNGAKAELKRLVASKGWGWDVVAADAPAPPPVPEVAPPTDADVFNSIPRLEEHLREEEADRLMALVRRGRATAEQKEILRRHFYCAHFAEPDEVTGEHYEAVAPHMDKLANIWSTENLGAERLMLAERGYQEKSAAEGAHYTYPKLELMEALARALGLQGGTGVLDLETAVTSERFEEAAVAVEEAIRKAGRVGFQLRYKAPKRRRPGAEAEPGSEEDLHWDGRPGATCRSKVNQCYQQWCGARFEKLDGSGKRSGRGAGRGRQREYTYRLEFPVAVASSGRTLRDVALGEYIPAKHLREQLPSGGGC